MSKTSEEVSVDEKKKKKKRTGTQGKKGNMTMTAVGFEPTPFTTGA